MLIKFDFYSFNGSGEITSRDNKILVSPLTSEREKDKSNNNIKTHNSLFIMNVIQISLFLWLGIEVVHFD